MDIKITVDLFKEIDLSDAVLVQGFPGAGLAGNIAANYIIKQLELERIGSIASEYFPPAAIIQNYTPAPPFRLYGNENIIVLISEMAPTGRLAKPFADSILVWVREVNIKRIICLESLIKPDPTDQSGGEFYSVGSTEGLRALLSKADLQQLKEGMVTGVAGALLNEGDRLNYEVLCFLSEANPMYPDARAAAKHIEAFNKLYPNLKIDAEKLYEEAKEIEEGIQQSVSKAKQYLESHQMQQERLPPTPYMYG